MSRQERLELLEAENRMLREQLAQRDQLISQLQERLQTLEERLNKDSHNSHLPPSSDRFARQPKSLRKKSGKKAGGQAKHPGQSLSLSLTPDEIVVHRVECCSHCQHDLHLIVPERIERRQVVEVPQPAVLVREHQSEEKRCPRCQQISTASFPQEVRAPVQYGPTIAAIAVYLVQQHLLPLARTCEILADLLDVHLSEATLCSMIERCAEQLLGVEGQIKEALGRGEVIHQDETGLYVTGKRHWMHVSSTGTLTHYQVHASRGHKALEAIGIVPTFRGTSVHDGFGSYFRYGCQHALCNVHILRELTFLAEEQGWWWAAKLKALLLEMKEASEQARTQARLWLDPLEVVDWQVRFLQLLDEGDQAHPRAHAPPGKRGRVKQSAGRNLLDRLRKYQQAVWAFLEDLRVPFDNNQAERDLRMVKVQQKVSGGFRTFAGAQAFSRIRGYLSTLRKQGVPLLSALQATLLGHPVLPSFS